MSATIQRVRSLRALHASLAVDHPEVIRRARAGFALAGLAVATAYFVRWFVNADPDAKVIAFAAAFLIVVAITGGLAAHEHRKQFPDLPEHEGWDNGIPAELRAPEAPVERIGTFSALRHCLAPECNDPAIGTSALCDGHLKGAPFGGVDLMPLLSLTPRPTVDEEFDRLAAELDEMVDVGLDTLDGEPGRRRAQDRATEHAGTVTG